MEAGIEDADGIDGKPGIAGDVSLNGVKESVSDNIGPNNGDVSICRDYMRNVCTRGKKCKYSHPEGKNEGGAAASALLQVRVLGSELRFSLLYCSLCNRSCTNSLISERFL